MQRKKYIIVGRRYNKSNIFAVALCSAFGSISIAMLGATIYFAYQWLMNDVKSKGFVVTFALFLLLLVCSLIFGIYAYVLFIKNITYNRMPYTITIDEEYNEFHIYDMYGRKKIIYVSEIEEVAFSERDNAYGKIVFVKKNGSKPIAVAVNDVKYPALICNKINDLLKNNDVDFTNRLDESDEEDEIVDKNEVYDKEESVVMEDCESQKSTDDVNTSESNTSDDVNHDDEEII